MRGSDQKYPRWRFVFFVVLTCAILFTLGCNLLSTEYWVHRLDDEVSEQPPESLPLASSNGSSPSTVSDFGSTCLNSTGDAPCPIEACVVYKGQYTTKYVVISELFGKANPSDYQCTAEFGFTNNSGVDLMGFEHRVTEFDDNWYLQLYSAGNKEQTGNCVNYFTRKDGKETLVKGVTEVVILYANPHCDWIQWDEPGLVKYREPVEAGCYPN